MRVLQEFKDGKMVYTYKAKDGAVFETNVLCNEHEFALKYPFFTSIGFFDEKGEQIYSLSPITLSENAKKIVIHNSSEWQSLTDVARDFEIPSWLWINYNGNATWEVNEDRTAYIRVE